MVTRSESVISNRYEGVTCIRLMRADRFRVLDLPGIDSNSIDLTVEQNVFSTHTDRWPDCLEGARRVAFEGGYGTETIAT